MIGAVDHGAVEEFGVARCDQCAVAVAHHREEGLRRAELRADARRRERERLPRIAGLERLAADRRSSAGSQTNPQRRDPPRVRLRDSGGREASPRFAATRRYAPSRALPGTRVASDADLGRRHAQASGSGIAPASATLHLLCAPAHRARGSARDAHFAPAHRGAHSAAAGARRATRATPASNFSASAACVAPTMPTIGAKTPMIAHRVSSSASPSPNRQ